MSAKKKGFGTSRLLYGNQSAPTPLLIKEVPKLIQELTASLNVSCSAHRRGVMSAKEKGFGTSISIICSTSSQMEKRN
jgi:hypothetical protein